MTRKRKPAYFTRWPKKMGLKRCARGSIRTRAANASTRILFCCPPGKWMPRKKKCRVGMAMHVIYKRGGFKKKSKSRRAKRR